MSADILLVDDDMALSRTVARLLEREGHRIRQAGSAEEGLVELRKAAPDLLILDVKMPGMSGFDLCRKIRETAEWSALPVIFLTSRDTEINKVTGLELGADDYVTKPFSAAELAARVKAALRRRTLNSSAAVEVLTDGLVTADPSRHETTVAGEKKNLSAKEFDLLCAFLRQKGRVLSKAYLMETVWGDDAADRDTHTVETHIYRLRKKLGPAADQRISSIGSKGYKWNDAA